jgi:spore coat protein SA
MIYHLLPEVEPFSEHAGGALSRWAANTLRRDKAKIICPCADSSWGFAHQRIVSRLGMRLYGKFLKHREFRLRVAHRVRILRWLMRGIVRQLGDGDVLYIHNRPEYVLALPGAGIRAFKVVLHMHNDHLVNLTLEQKAALDPDLAIFNSGFLAAQGHGLVAGLRRTAVLHNGADEDYFYPANKASETRPPVILFVGRIIPEKGVHILVSAMRALQAEGVEAVARIVGSVNFGDRRSSDYLDGLRASAPDTVEFRPQLGGKALADEFRRASIFCCPSTWEEPFGMVNVEAMASGLPVVATRTGGIPEIFAEGGALLVERNSVEELTDALKQLVVNDALRRRLAREGFASYQKRFRWSVIANEYQKLMDGLHHLPLSRISYADPDIDVVPVSKSA